MIKILTNLEKHMYHVRSHLSKLVHCMETAGLCHQYQRVPSNHFGKLCLHLCCKCNWLPSESNSLVQIFLYATALQNCGRAQILLHTYIKVWILIESVHSNSSLASKNLLQIIEYSNFGLLFINSKDLDLDLFYRTIKLLQPNQSVPR